MGSSKDEEPEEAEKSKESLMQRHDYVTIWCDVSERVWQTEDLTLIIVNNDIVELSLKRPWVYAIHAEEDEVTMGSSEDEEPEEAEKSKECLAAHGYTVGKTLGAGSYSTVKLVSKDGASYACKIISKIKSSVIYRVKFLPRELKILGSTRHPHITQIYTIIEEPTKVFVIMEMACGGDLLEKILKVKRLDEKTTHQFFMQLASALAYLHKVDVAHRDLKCENVLLTTVDVVKLTDFSFARYCTDEHTKHKELSETFCGSEAYAAPEILQGICYLPKLADVWSLGVILYVMVTGLLPYESNGLLRQVLPLSQELKNLIRGMLEPVVTLRASMGRVIRHPWIKRYPSPFKEINRKIYAYEASQHRIRLEEQSVSRNAPPGGPAVHAHGTHEPTGGDISNQSSDESSLREPERQAAKEDVSLKDEADAEQPEGEDAIAKNEGSSSSTSSKKSKDNKASKARGSSKKKGSSKAPRGEQVSQAGSSKESKM
ncbi:testis-specific serine/threonine-protein kinase 3-like [Rhipicephalus microplus]|uniref:testis-specific serine/threonine-protein kinase 3-like n=1 Tax=Rhipicephalus microplus TaxID=6941 RepID=UPI003F6C10F0